MLGLYFYSDVAAAIYSRGKENMYFGIPTVFSWWSALV